MATILELRFSFSALTIAIIAVTLILTGQATATDWCEGATNVPLCKSLLKGKTQAKQATEFMINKLKDQVLNARDKARKLGKNENIKICIESYSDAISDLNGALNYFKNGDKKGVQTEISAFISSVETCEDAYAEEDSVSPLVKNNTYMKFIADICLSVYQKAN